MAAEQAIAVDQTDLIIPARGLWADPAGPHKIREERQDTVPAWEADCGDACMQVVMKGGPGF